MTAAAPRPAGRAFFGHHKCGTTWLRRMLGDLFEGRTLTFHNWLVFDEEASPYARLFLRDALANLARPEETLVMITDASEGLRSLLSERGEVRAIHVIRDPRDLLVSAYYSHLHSHSIEDFPALARHRRELEALPAAEGMAAVMRFLAPVYRALAGWDYQRASCLELRYEDLVRDCAATLVEAGAWLGLAREGLAAAARRAADRHSFARASGGRTSGQEDVRSHFRRGEPGDWQTHFDARLRASFVEATGELVEQLGYAW